MGERPRPSDQQMAEVRCALCEAWSDLFFFLTDPLGTGKESEVRVGDSFKSDPGQLLEKGHSLHVRNPSQLGFPGAKR